MSDLFKPRIGEQPTIEEVRKFVQLDTIDDCKHYLSVMLDFYFDVIKSPEGRKATSDIEYDRNIWMQTMFSKGCQFTLSKNLSDFKWNFRRESLGSPIFRAFPLR